MRDTAGAIVTAGLGFGAAALYTWVLLSPNANKLTSFLNEWRRQGTRWELVAMIIVFAAVGAIGVYGLFGGFRQPPPNQPLNRTWSRLLLRRQHVTLARAAPRRLAVETLDAHTMPKTFRLRADQIKRILPPIGGCIASDRITVDGAKVGFMYRDEPRNPMDSGWQFTAGDETAEYMDEPSNHAIYDVNTIANYDPSIIPHLGAPVGAAFVRDPESGELRAEN